MKKIIFIMFAGLTLTGCANTRDPQSISALQPGDNEVTCGQIVTEYASNTESAAVKITKNNEDDTRDILVGVFVWPGLVDVKNADGTEGNALLDRNIRLKNIAIEKKCIEVASLPVQPVRYD